MSKHRWKAGGGALRAILAAACLAAAAPAYAEVVADWRCIPPRHGAVRCARRVDRGVMQAESGGRTQLRGCLRVPFSRSPGSVGLQQRHVPVRHV
jgi:hypothetical protein